MVKNIDVYNLKCDCTSLFVLNFTTHCLEILHFISSFIMFATDRIMFSTDRLELSCSKLPICVESDT